MDLLHREIERKKRALELAKKKSSVAAISAKVNSSSTATTSSSTSTSSLTAATDTSSSRFRKTSELRRLQEEEEGQLAKRRRTTSTHGTQQSSSSPPPPVAKPPPALVAPQGGPTAVESSSQTTTTTTTTALADKLTTEESTSLGESSSLSLSLSSSMEITHRLRSMGLAIRLFGEHGDSSRVQRLQAALALEQKTLATLSEKEDFRLGQGHGIRNPFLEKNNNNSRGGSSGGNHSTDLQSQQQTQAQQQAQLDLPEDDNDDLYDPSDPHKRIYKYFKTLLQQWEDDLAKRPDSVRQSVAGKNETKTLLQCKDYIRPLFKLLKKRQLEESLTQHLLKIVIHCQEGEFVKANDAYMDVAIGRAAWPIGVTMVGIHARTGRAKIESANVAHVMNSELQRKYLTSVKRLVTFAQKKATHVDPSKKVLN